MGPFVLLNESRFTEHVTNVKEPGVAVGNGKMPGSNIIQHERFGSGSVMIWGISLEGWTDPNMLLGHRQILSWCSGPWVPGA